MYSESADLEKLTMHIRLLYVCTNMKRVFYVYTYHICCFPLTVSRSPNSFAFGAVPNALIRPNSENATILHSLEFQICAILIWIHVAPYVQALKQNAMSKESYS